MLAEIHRHLEAQSQTIIDLQRALVAIPALGPMNGGPGEKDKTEFLKGYLRDMGFAKVRELRAPDPAVPCGYRPSLAAVVPGENTSKTLWVISHTDIVPPGDLALWHSDPYTLKVDGDIIIGRGVEDNHQGIVCSLLVSKALLDLGLTPPMNYGVLLVADEETGSKYGLDYVVKQHADLFGPDDLFLVPDFGEPTSEMIEIAEKSMFWLKVVVEGKQCHASTPEVGINSLLAASALIVQIPKLHQIFDRTDPLFNPPHSTFQATKKEANVENINTIPGRDVFYLDCRVMPGYDLNDVLSAIKGFGDQVERDHGVSISYEFVQCEQAAPPTPADSEVVTRLMRSVKSVFGNQPKVKGIGGGTVAAYLRRAGHKAAVWGTLMHNAHQPNERSSIKNSIKDAKVMAAMLFD
ncbi:MAG: M20 family metallo-hydrolase [Humidesulfovibrio sp.]|uniref:M20 family metallo-hydrolase n=1 Tax=Humidesulfovibrio sp. TaxID=2910988 RepID=UPI0027FD6EBB|nr:M20 family metallo-hydrolase [Humidesulfovibrio sp.]MDQ7834495.1 M20 family metallo-hydrolase [Humidesulfovibrio sp.]